AGARLGARRWLPLGDAISEDAAGDARPGRTPGVDRFRQDDRERGNGPFLPGGPARNVRRGRHEGRIRDRLRGPHHLRGSCPGVRRRPLHLLRSLHEEGRHDRECRHDPGCSAVTLTAGSRLGPYEIVAPLGAGGMGEVYRARDPKLGREVAIKVLPDRLAADANALARFEHEARAVASLSHPNILAIHDFGREEGSAYAVMELLDGQTLRDKLCAGPIPARQAVDYALQIAKGLSAAHEKGVVHRDLKPENLFVATGGHVKILDFGLAKKSARAAPGLETSAPTVTGRTEPGTVMGTVGYMSPE